MKNSNKKGFTIVELVIVIAVIAILAAVLIPTFASLVNKANVSKDTQLVRNLNTALVSDGKDHVTMTDALNAAAAFGYDVAKINASATNSEILWDSKNDVFCYLNEGEIQYIPETTTSEEASGADFWVISATVSDTYSTYLYNYNGDATVNAVHGLDVGNTEGVNVVYVNAGEVVIRTNGGTFTVNNAEATVAHYGESDIVDIIAVKDASYHEFGKASFTKITSGRYVAEEGAVANVIVIVDTANATAVANGGTISKTYENKTEDEIAAIQVGATVFAGGIGTKDDPYLIETAEHLQNVRTKYDAGYNYFKVKDGVTTIDCGGWPLDVNLNGSFDGNGVELVNLTAALFNQLGYQNTVQNITVENFVVTVNSKTALVHNLFNGGETTFKNIQMHGYIEAAYNIGSFYRYGTANYDGTGCSYTVNFVNCQSDVAIVETTGNTPGGLIGHPYQGTGNTVTINVDDKTAYTGTLYGTSTKGCYYSAIYLTGVSLTVNGETVTGWGDNNTYSNYNKMVTVPAEKAEDGSWVVEKQSSVTSMKVTVNCQISAYDADGNKIANESGITLVLDTKMLTELSDTTKVLDAFTKVELVSGADTYKAELVDGTLKIFITKSSTNSYDGTVRIGVIQYDGNGTIVSVGTTNIATIEK